MHPYTPGPNMDEPREFAFEAARRILNTGNAQTDSGAKSQLLMDLAEMIRQRMSGENLLEENSRWFVLPACGTRLSGTLTGHRL
jgi:hypothetical protein